ncbi:MAG TPA: hypothetical protein ENL03_03310, partial [Phycisphaerae bacterium]|nr:hypothetical protein [Phycisphaerae bacterium]
MLRIVFKLLVVVILTLSGCATDRSEQWWSTQTGMSYDVATCPSGSSSSPSTQADLPAEPSLDDCLAHGALQNPAMKSAFYHWRAMVDQITRAEAIPQPKFTYAYYIRQVETRTGAQRQSMSIAQKIPFPGKVKLRGQIARTQALQAYQEYQAVKLAVFSRIKEAWAEYYLLGKTISITKTNLTLLNSLTDVLQQQYRAGSAARSDVIRLQVEQARL